MEICSRFTGMERKDGAFLLHTDNADVKVCFVTDEIVRVRDYVEPSDDSQTDADRAAQAAAAAAEAARVDAQFYTCPACGYHNWTRQGNVYVCDTCADMNLMVLAVLVLAAAMVGGFACVARKHK